jgi:transposase
MKFPKINNEEQEVVVIFFCQKVDLKILLTAFIDSIKAGSPTDSAVFWVSQKPREIAQKFNQKYEQNISNGFVKRLLKELGYGYRKQSKTLATGKYCNRNAQFEIITMQILAMSLQSPVISMDCKKKERLRNLYRDGKCYSQEPIKVFDHDYDHLSESKVIPHGIYDLQVNVGYITLGQSAETAEFVTDNLLWWWRPSHGQNMEYISTQMPKIYYSYVMLAELILIDIIFLRINYLKQVKRI